MNTYCADFETTTDPEDCRVWAWGLASVDKPDDVEIDHELDDFLFRISMEDSICYFHNLKFDGRFILDKLFRDGFRLATPEGKRNPKPGWFTTMIGAMGQFYTIKVTWRTGFTTEFRDSLKKIPLKISQMAKAFGMEMTKGDIDYMATRPKGYIMTSEERDYVRRDVVIMATAMRQVLDNGMTKLTVASDALKEYKSLIGKMFDQLFPVLSPEMDSLIRRAYRGGFTYADPRFKGKRLGSGIVLDVNSLYPSVMANSLIPYGEPIWFDGEFIPTDTYPVAIFTVTLTARIKPGHIPCIQIKGSGMFAPTEYLKVIDEPTELTMTNVDFALYDDHYDLDVTEFHGGWAFKAAVGLFDKYINKWADVKANSTGGQREIAKLFLNALYGKFATNPLVQTKIPYFKDDKVALKRAPDETRDPVYTAAGVFITSHARNLTIRAAQDHYDVFAYADTDSLHLLTDTVPDSLDVHPTRMGAWKLEYHFVEAMFVRPKFYLERVDEENYHVALAGFPNHLSAMLTFNDIENGRVLDGKLKPRAVPGGIVLEPTPYKIEF